MTKTPTMDVAFDLVDRIGGAAKHWRDYEWHIDRVTLKVLAEETGTPWPPLFPGALNVLGIPVVIAEPDEPGIALRRRSNGAHALEDAS